MPVIPPIKTLRGVPRVLSQAQDSTRQAFQATQAALNQQAAQISGLQTAGKIASGVLVYVNTFNPGFQLVTHGLGRVAYGFILVNSTTKGMVVSRDPQDPEPGSPQPTQANKNPTQTIRLQTNQSTAVAAALWIF